MPLDMPLSINPFAMHRKKKAVFPIVLFHLNGPSGILKRYYAG